MAKSQKRRKNKIIFTLSGKFPELAGISENAIDQFTFSADFETSAPEWVEKDGCARVWAWGLCPLFSDWKVYGNSCHSFIVFVWLLGKAKIYFANAKFDTSFLCDYALKNGIPSDFSLCDDNFFHGWLFGEYTGAEIFDSLKILGGKIATQAKTWGLDISKVDEPKEFYRIYREKNHILTLEEKTYLQGDIIVQRDALLAAFRFGLGVGGITKAGCYFYAFKKYIEKESGEPFLDIFPKFGTPLTRAAYNGGYCIVNPAKAGKVLSNVKCYDINAMYAAAYSGSLPKIDNLRSMEKFPFGLPVLCTTDEKEFYDHAGKNDLYFFVRVNVKVAVLKSGRIPSLQFKRRYTMDKVAYYNSREYRTTFEKVDLFLSETDFYNIFLQDYTADFTIEEAEFYKARDFSLFKKWASEWSELKAATSEYLQNGEKNPGYNPGMRQIAKDALTNPYGKFGMRQDKTLYIPKVTDGGEVAFDLVGDEKDTTIYPAFAAAVTSAARSFITRVVQKNAKAFVYSDTDSVKMEDELPPELVDPVRLGFFKFEGVYQKAKFLRAKTYMHTEGGKTDYTVCGLPDDGKKILQKFTEKEQYKRFREGLTVPGCKLRPVRVNGGIVLVPSDFTINCLGGFFL